MALANDADRQWLNAYLVNVKAAVRVGCGFLIRQVGVEPWPALQRDGLLDGQRQCGGCIGQRDFHTCMGTVIAQTADIQGALREVGVGKRNIHKAGKCIRLAGLVALRPRADGVAVAWANVCIVHTEQGVRRVAVFRSFNLEGRSIPHKVIGLHASGVVHIVEHAQGVLAAQQGTHGDGVASDAAGQWLLQHGAVFLHQCIRLVRGAHRLEEAQHHGPRRHKAERRGGDGDPPAAHHAQLGAVCQHFFTQCRSFLHCQRLGKRRVVIHPTFQFGHRSNLLQ